MEELERLIDEIVAISESLSKTHTGALIVFEREVGLNDYIDTGVAIEGLVSQELLGNIFIPNTPLHDGAVIIRENRIMAAGCLLPLTADRSLSTELGIATGRLSASVNWPMPSSSSSAKKRLHFLYLWRSYLSSPRRQCPAQCPEDVLEQDASGPGNIFKWRP